MNRDDLCYDSTVSLAGRIRAGEVSPTDAVHAYLERIERVDPAVHAYLHLASDHARRAARRAEQALARGDDLGPLHGVPIAVKDLFDTAGMPTTCGSPRVLRGNVPTRTATAVARLEQAGAILLGKLHMTEFAFITHHPDTQAARNPWAAADRSPGGSSSGSAVAAAAGLASATLGSDTAASIRLPAAWCGAVGLKPTWGRVSRDGVFPLSASLDHVGPITRTVADAALLLHCIAGPDPRDPSTRHQAAPAAEPAPRDDFRGVRVGWDEDFVTMGVMPNVVAATRAARARMEALGATVVPVALPDLESTVTTIADVFDVEMRAAHAGLYPERASDYGPLTRHALARFAARDPLVHIEGAIRARAFRQRIDRMFDEVDALLCPVAALTASPLVDDETIIRIFGDDHRNVLRLTRLTSYFDLAATPAISLPWGFAEDGLPLAVQLVTRVGSDEKLLSLAARLEVEAPDRGRRPPLE
ncbi:MAG: amidase [Thermodesulfobacteriota bacterium]